MKRVHLGMMTLLALVLGACGNGQTKDAGAEQSQVTQAATTAEVTTVITTTVAPKPDNKELYAKVFEDIRTVKELGTDVAGKLNVPLEYWAANSLNKQKDSLQYLFYDINDDGVDELFIGHTSNGKPFTVVAYYLDGKTPKILQQSYIAEVGGSRSTFSLFKGGLIYMVEFLSGTGNGEAKVFKLESRGVGLTLVNSLKFEKMQFKLEDLGLKQEDNIDLTKMNWKEFK